MNTATITEIDNIANFKLGVNSLLQKRQYFAKQVLPMLVENKDYYTIKGKKSLGKAGAEKLASIYQLVATFVKDKETMESFRGINGLVAYVCNLTRNNGLVGQGRGAAILKDNGNDANKTIKMSQKSAFIDGVIRSTGLSDIFTQDIENMATTSTDNASEDENKQLLAEIPSKQYSANYQPEMITEKQKKFLATLIFEHINGEKEQEKWLSGIDGYTKEEGSELISSLLMSAGR